MTFEQLEQYFGIVRNIEAIDEEIKQLYHPISSPNGRQNTGTRSNTPSAPTERAAMLIIEKRTQAEEQRRRMEQMRDEIDAWLATCKDAEICAIVRWRYKMRKNWREVNLKVYGYPDYNYSRRKVIRYFQKMVKNERE